MEHEEAIRVIDDMIDGGIFQLSFMFQASPCSSLSDLSVRSKTKFALYVLCCITGHRIVFGA